jgi:hypothetical protein
MARWDLGRGAPAVAGIISYGFRFSKPLIVLAAADVPAWQVRQASEW